VRHGIFACLPKLTSGFFLVILKDLFYQLMEKKNSYGQEQRWDKSASGFQLMILW
jgi:hypothetical protein